MTEHWFCYDQENNLILKLYVQPGAKSTGSVGLHGDALKIKLAATAVDGKANTELVKFLATRFEVPIKRIMIKQGSRSRNKVILIQQSFKNPDILLDRGE